MALQRHLVKGSAAAVFLAGVAGLPFSLEQSVHLPLAVWLAVTALLAATLLGLGRWLLGRPLPEPRGTDAQWLLGVCGVALATRVAWVLVADTEPVSDFADYRNLAHALCHAHRFGVSEASAFRPVGWPFVLSLLDCAGLDLPRWGGLFNAAAQAATVPAIFLWARDLAGRRAALGASLLFALWPAQILGCSLLATEPLFTLLLTWVLYLASVLPRVRRPWLLALALGALVGGAAYVRSTALPLPIALAALALLGRRRPWRLLGQHALILATALLCLLPWGLRNQREMGKFSLTTSNEGATLILGNSDNADGRYIEADQRPFVPDVPGEMAQDAAARQVAHAWITQHPLRFLQLIPRKWLALWGPEFSEAGWAMRAPRWQFAREAAMAASEAFFLLVLALAALVARRLPAQRVTDPASAVLLLFFAVHVLFHGQDRFHAPLVPVLCLLAGAGCATLTTKRR